MTDSKAQKASGRSAPNAADFLADGGEMGALLRAHDWKTSSLGEPATWPQPLRTAVRMVLNTSHPMYIFWGEDGACLYNDAYRQSIGPERHPGSLGRPAREVWDEIWDIIGPQIEQVMSGGGSTWHEDHLVPITRNGRREDVYWTYSYGPIDDQSAASGVGGVVVICTETTESVLVRQRQAFQIELDEALVGLGDPSAAMATASRMICTYLGAGRCGYGEVDVSGEYLTVESDWTDGRMPSLAGRHRLDAFGPAVAAELRAGRSLRIDDSLIDARTTDTQEAFKAAGDLRAVIGIPLVKDGQLIATFYIHQSEPRSWTDEDVAFMQHVAERTWAAVERARAEAALQASDMELRFALMAGRLGAWSLDVASDQLRTSERFRANFGIGPRGDFSFDELKDAVHPEDRAPMLETLERSLETGADFDAVYRTVAPNGDIRWMTIRGQPRYGIDGRPVRIAGVSYDSSERMEVAARQSALIELSDTFRQIDNPAEIAYAASEVMGRTLRVDRVGYGTIDPVAETITIERDWNAEGIKSLAGVLHFRDYGSYIEDLKRGETVVFADAETDPRTRESAEALKRISARSVVNMPVTEQDGFVALLYLTHGAVRNWSNEELAFIRDVAERTRMAIERRRAEQELRAFTTSLERTVEARTGELEASQARLRTIFETSFQYQGFLALDGTLLDANATFLEGIDCALDEVVGKPLWETPWFSGTPGMPETVREGIEAAARGETLRHEIVIDLAGERRHFDFALRPLRDESGEIVGIIPEAVETTERHAAEEQLRQAQKMEAVGNLTGGVAHDFNNLLQVIGGNLQLLSRGVSGERAQQQLRNALEGVNRGSNLASQLLAFGRRQPLAPKVVNLGRFVRGLDEMLRRALGEGVEIETVVSGGLWNTLVDPSQVENALLNLAINARDAMEGHGKLTIEAGNISLDEAYSARHPDVQAGQYVMLAVTDTGAGMTSDVIEHAFEPFFTTKKDGQGTGLGLSMVWGLVKQSEGHIAIYSEPGQGTTIRIYLPRVRQNEDLPVEVDDSPVTGGKESILLVEDDEGVRTTVAALLSDLGYRVLKAQDAQSALVIIESGIPIDLLFTDVVMPGPMRSTELAKKARERQPGIAVLFTSGYTQNAIFHAGRLDEGVELLSKPYSHEALARKIRQMLGKPAENAGAGGEGDGTNADIEKSLRILLVEDDTMVRMSTADLLASFGHEVTAAADATEALALLEQQTVDVLFTDITLPGRSGIELALQARRSQPSMRIVFASGLGELPETREREELGEVVFLRKPYDDHDLSTALDRVAE